MLDRAAATRHALAMTDNPYSIPEDELVDSARVPVAEQVVEVPERRFYGSDAGGDPLAGNGVVCDADGE